MVRHALVLYVFVFSFVLPLSFTQSAAQGRQNGQPSTTPASNLRVLYTGCEPSESDANV